MTVLLLVIFTFYIYILSFLRSPHRFVHAMLDSHQDMEQMKVMGALKSMQQMSGQQQQPALQLVLGGQQQQVQKDDMFKKMMMKMMLKKMFNEDSSSPFGNMDSSSSDKFDMLKMLTQHMRNVSKNDRRCLTVMDFKTIPNIHQNTYHLYLEFF